MLYNRVLNEMNVDELRNYVYKLQELESLHSEIICTKDAIIEHYERLVFDTKYTNDRLLELNSKQGKLRELVQELEEKYQYALPTPQCGSTTKEEI